MRTRIPSAARRCRKAAHRRELARPSEASLIAALGETDDARGRPDARRAPTASSRRRAARRLRRRCSSAPTGRWRFLDAVKAKQIDAAALGPANAFRLRTHPDKDVAKRATDMLDELEPGGEGEERSDREARARWSRRRATSRRARLLFTATCAICHKFGEVGRGQSGPTSPAWARTAPANCSPPSSTRIAKSIRRFRAWNIETKDGRISAGIIARENPARSSCAMPRRRLRKSKSANIKIAREHRPLAHARGLEALGGEILRDIITYMCRRRRRSIRIVDLANAFTADGRRGIFASADSVQESVRIKKVR